MFSKEKKRLEHEFASRRAASGVILDALKNEELTPEKRQELIARYEVLLDDHYKEELATCEEIDDSADRRGFWNGYWLCVGAFLAAEFLPKITGFFFHKKE